MITLRPYQVEIIDSVFDGWQTENDLLVVAATGAGKTNVFWEIIDRFIAQKPGARVVVLAHRKELIEQPFDRLMSFWPHLLSKSGIVMGDTDECHRQIVVATVQTLGHKSKRRIKDLLRYGKVDLLITDECHHVAAKTYQTVIEDLRIANPELKHLGVTATPERGDKKALGTIYKKEVANVGVIRLIDEGFLCKPVVHGVKTSIDLSGVTVNGSGGNRDYNQEQLVAAVETDDCFKLVVKTHVDKISHRPTIAFVPSVTGAYRLADMLKEQGIKAIAADGNTPKEERAAIIRDFKAGRYTCICNVALWTEGLDLPNLECCHLVRPTKSDALYLQMVGRVLRTHPGKEVAEIFDYQPVGERNLHMRMRMLGIKRKSAYEGKALTGGGGMPAAPLHKAGDHVEYVILDYFEKTKKAWVTDDTGWRIIGFGMGDDEIERSLAISPDGQELWACWRKNGDRWHQAKQHSATGAEAILATVEEFSRKYSSSMSLASAPWRSKLPSEGQAKFARSLGLAIDGLNAGAVSDAINKKLVLQAIRRHGVKQAA